nr:MAG TPA: hypothetical protein [Caudoviricetes sp.]
MTPNRYKSGVKTPLFFCRFILSLFILNRL